MEEATSGTPGEFEMATEAAEQRPQSPATQPDLGQDSKLAGILDKQARGEKLNHAERGYLGSQRRKSAGKANPAPANKNPLLDPPTNPDNPLFAGGGSGEAAPQAPVAAPIDSALLRSTADAVLSSCDTITKIVIGHQAKKAGADTQTIADYKAAVELQPENRKLMVENSEPIVLAACKLLGCSPEKLMGYLKGGGFMAGMAAHCMSVSAALAQLKERQAELRKAKA